MSTDGQSSAICINLLTGFLGSGKTTLLKRLLADDAFADCAVLINELGEVGLDHQLLDRIDNEMVVLQNGCICCSVREDLRQALLSLHDRRERGVIPPFNRVVIESTGLADPVPVLTTIAGDAVLRHHYRLGNVVTTVDAVHAPDQCERQAEWSRQVAVADRVVITKADLVKADALDAVREAVRRINASAWLTVSHDDARDADVLLSADIDGPASRVEEARRLFARAAAPQAGGVLARPVPGHRDEVGTLSLHFERPLDWVAFGIWLSMLLHSHGADIWRVKGILNVEGSALPVVIHGVQQLIHAPLHLSAWPDDADRRSQLVLIGKLPPRAAIEASMQAFGF